MCAREPQTQHQNATANATAARDVVHTQIRNARCRHRAQKTQAPQGMAAFLPKHKRATYTHTILQQIKAYTRR